MVALNELQVVIDRPSKLGQVIGLAIRYINKLRITTILEYFTHYFIASEYDATVEERFFALKEV